MSIHTYSFLHFFPQPLVGLVTYVPIAAASPAFPVAALAARLQHTKVGSSAAGPAAAPSIAPMTSFSPFTGVLRNKMYSVMLTFFLKVM